MASRDYTPMGKRIVALGNNRQAPIARALGLTEKAISKKLRGSSRITCNDLERLAAYFGVPMTYFFQEEEDELTRAFRKIEAGPAPLRELTALVADLPEDAVEKILAEIRALDEDPDVPE
jgi:transcriptional regulator with XRE-family HTH domain